MAFKPTATYKPRDLVWYGGECWIARPVRWTVRALEFGLGLIYLALWLACLWVSWVILWIGLKGLWSYAFG